MISRTLHSKVSNPVEYSGEAKANQESRAKVE